VLPGLKTAKVPLCLITDLAICTVILTFSDTGTCKYCLRSYVFYGILASLTSVKFNILPHKVAVLLGSCGSGGSD
jgi:hypothetical protein